MLDSAGPARLLAIGDIHGCRRPLRELLDQVKPTAADALVFLMEHHDGEDPVNVGCGSDLSIRELAELIHRKSGIDLVAFSISSPFSAALRRASPA